MGQHGQPKRGVRKAGKPPVVLAVMASSTLGMVLNSFGLQLSTLTTFTLPSLEAHKAAMGPAVEGALTRSACEG